MAKEVFAKKYITENEIICPFCHKKHTKGYEIVIPNYLENRMCRDCFKHLYKNHRGKHTAAITDSPANRRLRRRPVQILEKPLFSKITFPTGYEYVMKNITANDIINRGLIALLFMAFGWIALHVYSEILGEGNMTVCTVAYQCACALISLITALNCPVPLIKGIFHGMGHPRRLLLTGNLLLFGVLTAMYGIPFIKTLISL